MIRRLLICTVGLPRSGKTTWAQQQGYPIVSPDAIRYALHGQRFAPRAEPIIWATATIMARALFLAGHEVVIVDATNGTRKRRDAWQSDEWVTEFKYIGTSRNDCLDRAKKLGDNYIIPVIERMADEFEILGTDERIYPYGLPSSAPTPATAP